MNPRTERAAVDAAEWDVVIGWGTGAVLVAMRAFMLAAIARADEPAEAALTAQMVVQLVLASAFTWGVYRRQRWAAIGLLVLWGLGWFYSWYAQGRVIPPLGLIGIAIWYGLYRGWRGVRVLAERREGGVGGVTGPV